MTIIKAIHTTRVLAPVKRPIRTASGDIGAFPLVLIDVATDAGITGRAYVQVYLPALLPALESTVRCLGELIQGRELMPRDVHAFLLKRLRLWGVKNLVCTALGGLDMALWDAYARARNEPLYATLGAAPTGVFPTVPSFIGEGGSFDAPRAVWYLRNPMVIAIRGTAAI